jgi:hypothetical protein
MPNESLRRGLNIREDIKQVIDMSIPVDTRVEDFLLPEIKVNRTGGSIQLTIAHAGHELTDNRRSKEGTFIKGGFRYTKDSFETEMYGNMEDLDMVQTGEVSNVYDFDEETYAGNLAVARMRTMRKMRVRDAIFEDADFASIGHTLIPTTKWNTDPLAILSDVRTVKDKLKARHGVVGSNLWFGITENDFDSIIMALVEQDTLKYNETILTKSYDEQRNILRQLMKVSGVVILDGMVSSAKDFFEEQADFVNVYEPGSSLFFIPSTGGQSWSAPGLGRQPIYAPYSDSYIIDTWEEKKDMKYYVRGSEYRGTKVNPAYGVKVTGMFTS